ncbi:hypothetical protein MPTK1_5g02960 [Marchantia polymorpha subsp. ruderalis]|uniref:Uncharacterized protein n=2 Tax=Marchantia polymorpha TaxID=3197 RepID=A0A176WBH1_MARPO|nr:hypothetical protein AXG93_3884s1280 [Marchantia polymorpha subsp. ruderalis]PTQ30454.1 hypothetical protein MARPO_0124s0027 [Marchantia polymorpha]BBN10363.1 hypothetical protein Mp_5g02960 [Marchantia polymorpha subsp. ruderalis]|eukprot:PTQ30454.1 hypothetical protein MARPO_0124s0027 [Marchantia polymorpha]
MAGAKMVGVWFVSAASPPNAAPWAAAPRAGPVRGTSPQGCSSSMASVSSSSSYGGHGSFGEEAVLGVQLPKRTTRHRTQTVRAVSDVTGPVPIPKRVRKVKETKVVVMVDPVEAKRLAAVEMEAVKARQKRKKQREIEAINGGFAVLGLTAGLVLEGYTGKGILVQIAGYLDGLAGFLTQFTSPMTPTQEIANTLLQEITAQISPTQEYLQKIVNSQ